MGQVVHTLPEGRQVCGLASLADEVYVLRRKDHYQLEVYDAKSFRLQRSLTVRNFCVFADMTSCEHDRCVYIAKDLAKCIHRLDVQGADTQWAVNDKPWGISVNAAHNVLVTCGDARKIKEFSSHGYLLRELTLPNDVVHRVYCQSPLLKAPPTKSPLKSGRHAMGRKFKSPPRLSPPRNYAA